MSPRRQPRRIVESDDNESLPDTWEEMQRTLEPMSPAAAPEQPQVITIDDDEQAAPEPSFEVLLSMTESVPQEPAPESAPEPAQEPAPESEPAPPQEPAQERPESPQPGPSGIQEPDDSGQYGDYSEYYLSQIDECVGTLSRDNAECKHARRVIAKARGGITGINLMIECLQDVMDMYANYKEAYRVSRRVYKRKLEQFEEEVQSKVRVETKRFRDKCDGYIKQTNEALAANEMLHRQISTVESESRDYMEQRDQAEAAVDQLKAKLSQEKTKVYNLKKYTAALKGAMEDKDKTIRRLEAELTQTRRRLHQFTRISKLEDVYFIHYESYTEPSSSLNDDKSSQYKESPMVLIHLFNGNGSYTPGGRINKQRL